MLNRVLEKTTVLPGRFGVVFPDDQALVEELLRPQYRSLSETLDRLDGAVEVSVKATYLEEQVLKEVVKEQPQLAGRSGSGYAGRIDVGRRVAAAIEAKRDHDAARLLDRLTPLARDVAVGRAASNLMVLNASFLVERGRMRRFDEALEKIDATAGHRLRLGCVGPLPPYSFVDLDFKASSV